MIRPCQLTTWVALAAACASCSPVQAAENGKFRIGIVTFLSGGAAGPFGVPAANAAKLTVAAINGGTLPAPYNRKGIAGAEIELILVDENGGSTKQVEEYRNLVQRQKVDAVIGYISSGDCLAVAPVVEELQVPTIFFDCGTSRLFGAVKTPKYLFRTGLDAVVDNIALARYVAETRPHVKSVGAINRNYAWGRESWADFALAFRQLRPESKVAVEQWPTLGQGQYGAEVSALAVANPDMIYSSFWGGDMEAFVTQGSARGLFDNRLTVLTAGETGLDRFKDQLPNGSIVGARGPFGAFAPKNALSDWLRTAYNAEFKEAPTYPAFKMAQALLGLKAAAERNARAGAMPTAQQLIDGLRGLTFEAPSGTVQMSRSGGHQAVQPVHYGEYRYDEKTRKTSLTNVKVYAGECVMPPDGATPAEWIGAGFPGAKCN
jgi:branched-chain amino acid transport system substrate-binding protein